MVRVGQRRVAVVTVCSLLLSPPIGIPAAALAAAAPAAAATVPDNDGGWPRSYPTPSGAAFVIYQPQVASWADQKRIVLYVAASYTAKGAAKPALGTLKLEAG